MAEPRWLTEARKHVGLREYPGKKNNPTILQWWVAIRAGFTDDATPWCAAFVGAMLEGVGVKSSRSAAARSYEKWGRKLDKPINGCIITFQRRGGGHVGFYVGETDTHVLVLGGNQSDAVSVARFSKTNPALKITGYWWPKDEPLLTGRPRKETVVEGGPVTLIGQPDDPGVEVEAEESWLTAKFKHGWNAALTFGGTLLSGLYDYRIAIVICTFGFLVFLVIWFTHARSKCR